MKEKIEDQEKPILNWTEEIVGGRVYGSLESANMSAYHQKEGMKLFMNQHSQLYIKIAIWWHCINFPSANSTRKILAVIYARICHKRIK